MTDPLSIHLKYIDRGDNLFLKQVADLKVGAEGGPLVLEGDSLAVVDVEAM